MIIISRIVLSQEGRDRIWWISIVTFCRGWTMGPRPWRTRWRWPGWRRIPASRTSSPRPIAICRGTGPRITAPPPCARPSPGCSRPWTRRASPCAFTRGPRCSALRSCPGCWTSGSSRPWAGAGICWWNFILTSLRSLWSSASGTSATGAWFPWLPIRSGTMPSSATPRGLRAGSGGALSSS